MRYLHPTGNQILTKQLQVPHVAPAKQRQIIAVEAQQSVHNFAQLEWDSQILHDDELRQMSFSRSPTAGFAGFLLRNEKSWCRAH